MPNSNLKKSASDALLTLQDLRLMCELAYLLADRHRSACSLLMPGVSVTLADGRWQMADGRWQMADGEEGASRYGFFDTVGAATMGPSGDGNDNQLSRKGP